METEENMAVKFLLGKLSDDEQASIEREYFQNTSSFEELLIAENSLTDAYVSGGLSPEDRRRFEQRLLINPRQQQRAAFAGALIKYASSQPVQDLEFDYSWKAAFAGLFSRHRVFSYSFAAIAFIFFAGALLLWSLNVASPPLEPDLARTQTPVEIETPGPDTADPADANEAPLEDEASNGERKPKRSSDQTSTRREPSQNRAAAPMISSIILPLGSTRDAGPPATFIVPEKANFVKVQLPFETGDFSSYFVVVETVDGQQVWKGKVVKSGGNKLRKTVAVTIPASRLKRGDYIIALKGLGKAGAYESVGDYSVTLDIERPARQR